MRRAMLRDPSFHKREAGVLDPEGQRGRFEPVRNGAGQAALVTAWEPPSQRPTSGGAQYHLLSRCRLRRRVDGRRADAAMKSEGWEVCGEEHAIQQGASHQCVLG